MSNDFSNKVVTQINESRRSVPVDFAHITGSYNLAFILQHCFYWSQRTSCKIENTFYTQHAAIAEKLFLSERTIQRGLDKLSSKSLIDTRKSRAAFKKKVDGKDVWYQSNCIFITVNCQLINEMIECSINGLHKRQGVVCEEPDEIHRRQSVACETVHRRQVVASHIQIVNNTNSEYLTPKKNDYKNDELSIYDSEPAQSLASSEQSLPALRITELSATQYNPYCIPENLLVEWAISRRKKKSPINKTSWNEINKQLSLCEDGGIKAIDAFTKMVAYGWPSLDAKKMIEFDKSSSEKKGGAVDMNSNDWGNEPSLF